MHLAKQQTVRSIYSMRRKLDSAMFYKTNKHDGLLGLPGNRTAICNRNKDPVHLIHGLETKLSCRLWSSGPRCTTDGSRELLGRRSVTKYYPQIIDSLYFNLFYIKFANNVLLHIAVQELKRFGTVPLNKTATISASGL